jgi:[acyl-carrier-protein] S-malonyltransferase
MVKTCAFLFPGQGAQYVGMGKDFYENIAQVKSLYERANALLDFDIAKVCFQGPQEIQNRTDISQPAIFLTSLSAIEAYRTRFDINNLGIGAVAGLSLGEYTALVFNGSIRFEDGLLLVKRRGEFMQKASDMVESGMAGILGLDYEKIEIACKEGSKYGIVNIANLNCPGQIVISGEKNALSVAIKKCIQLGARRTIPLAVAGAYHSPIMKPAQDEFRKVLSAVMISKPSVPLVTNVDARFTSDPIEIRKALEVQMTSPVLWEISIKAMVSSGIRIFFEFGPGRVLTGLVRKINPEVKLYNVEKLSDLDGDFSFE